MAESLLKRTNGELAELVLQGGIGTVPAWGLLSHVGLIPGSPRWKEISDIVKTQQDYRFVASLPGEFSEVQ